MKKITEYQVVIEESNTTLSRSISELITAGWQPYGPPLIENSINGSAFVQAVVKYEKD